MAFKKWVLPSYDKDIAAILSDECGISLLTASVLASRGHTTYEDAMRFLTQSEELSSPFDIKDMSKAVERIQDAIDSFEKITIYGDYDCDGVTSTAMLLTYLSSTGADVDYYIPAREGEGYGLNKSALKEIADRGTTLIITVDNGITAVAEAEYAASIGVDLVITDHHQPTESLPKAVAVIDPHRHDDLSSFKPLAGVGVAFKLIAALEGGDYQSTLEFFSDIAAIGTIGDIVSLLGENRIIVKHGLRLLSYSENFGINALIKVAGVDKSKLTAQNIAFMLVPRINAAGRMGHAGLAVSLLLSETEEDAEAKANELNALNKERQATEMAILSGIYQMLGENPQLLNHRVLILRGQNWHPGILGIVCSKLLDRFGKPVLLLNEEDGALSGSGRSLGEFHLFKALSSCSDILLRYGGHKLAAGLSVKVDDFDAFCQRVEEYATSHYETMPTATLVIDKVITATELTVAEFEQFSYLEPFGCQNEQPLFLIKNAKLISITPISNNRHLRLGISVENTTLTAMLFGFSTEKFIYNVGAVVDLAVNAELDEYNSRRSVSLKVKDIRPSSFSEQKYFAAKNCATKLLLNEPVSNNLLSAATPSRDEIAVVYKFLKAKGGFTNDFDLLFLAMGGELNYCKLVMALNILEEGGLINCRADKEKITLCEVSQKVDLSSTNLMKRLCAMSSEE